MILWINQVMSSSTIISSMVFVICSKKGQSSQSYGFTVVTYGCES